MRCRVLLFAGLRERVGTAALEIELPGASASVAAVRAAALARAPALHGQAFRVALNARYAEDRQEVAEGSELAFLPPVSGG